MESTQTLNKAGMPLVPAARLGGRVKVMDYIALTFDLGGQQRSRAHIREGLW